MWDHRARIETFTAENIDSIDQFRGLAKALAEAELAYTTAVSQTAACAQRTLTR